MRGTWQTTGGGPDWGPAATAFIAAALVAGAVAWLLARPWWELAGASVVLVLAAAGALRVRLAIRRMKAADLARINTRIQAVRAEVNPQVSPGTPAPAIEQHVHYHYHAVDARDVPAVIRREVER